MSLTHRHGVPWITGQHLHGDAGLGVLGATVPASGDNGPGLLYEAVVANGWGGAEVRLFITTQPAAGVLRVNENTAADFSGAPAGVFRAIGDVYVNGANLGPLTAWLYNGASSLVQVGAATLRKQGIGGADAKVYLTAAGTLAAKSTPATGDRLIGLAAGGGLEAGVSA